MKGIITTKVGMSRVIDQETGVITPVTVLKADACDILQVKTTEKDGYSSVVIGGFKKNKERKNANKNYREICEIKMEDTEGAERGGQITAADFVDVASVWVTGTTKGRGFSGVIKRWGFQRGRETHGSHHHREPGSVGMCSKPGKILKGKKLPGRYGGDKQTLRGVKIMQVDAEKGMIVVKGSVPGAKKSLIFIRA